VSFLPSPGADTLPAGLDDFDYIVLNGVYEHLLPEERNTLLPRIWERLKPGGVLFIGETPHRYFPYESHTTSLPFINYVPDGLALHFARRFSKRVRFDETWESLLRRGIRGATVREIMRILKGTAWVPIFLEAEKLDVKDRIDLWYKISSPARLATLKRFMAFCMTGFRCITGVTLTPNLSLAISKGG
jgi:SAM-dependent methyltransferase